MDLFVVQRVPRDGKRNLNSQVCGEGKAQADLGSEAPVVKILQKVQEDEMGQSLQREASPGGRGQQLTHGEGN